MSTSDKLDQVLQRLEETNRRISGLENALASQQLFISQLNKSGLQKYIENSNVEEACGVDPAHIEKNQLMGEIPKTHENESLSVKVIREERQSVGAKLYAAYIWFYFVLMSLSFSNQLPVLPIEAAFDNSTLSHSSIVLSNTFYIPFTLSVLYVVVIFTIQRMMKDSAPYNLRYPLAAWSLLIGMFSLFGSLRTVPALWNLLRTRGLEFAVCGDSRRDWLFSNPAGFWTGLFILSKIPELIDTLFIVLRKRKLITLHWYHHITVMLFCWHSWATHCLQGIFFSAMNLTVHAFMYIFYFLAALGFRPTPFAKYITLMQIAQMFVGTGISFYTIFHMSVVQPQPLWEVSKLTDLSWNIDYGKEFDASPKCKVNPGNAIYGFLMYSSYLWLFCVFFYYAYLKPRGSSRVAAAKKHN